MDAQNEIRVAPDVMIRLVRAIFESAGCAATEAACIAERLTGANLRGHDSHGVIRCRAILHGSKLAIRRLAKLSKSSWKTT